MAEETPMPPAECLVEYAKDILHVCELCGDFRCVFAVTRMTIEAKAVDAATARKRASACILEAGVK